MTNQLPRTCLIGAGSSGLPVIKSLKDRGVPFVCYEKSDRVGGNWVYGNTNGKSSAYRSLCINTPRQLMRYADLEMPKDIPDYPHHTHIAQYFDQYVDHFNLRENIQFQTGVDHVTPLPGGGYEVLLDTGETVEYDAVIVANGHHWDPHWPTPAFPGEFNGEQMHSHDYVDSDVARGKSVLVVGIGNSAVDIAVEISSVAISTALSTRRGAHVLPKYFFGRPVAKPIAALLSSGITRTIMQHANIALNGNPEKYGMPTPPPLSVTHPTISSRLIERLQHGAITPKTNIERFDGSDVVFADGSRGQFDLIIYATGYNVSFPFFDPDFVAAPGNKLPLYHHVFHPEHKNLMFIGLVQPLWALMPVAEWQGKWVGDYLAGRYALPGKPEMLASIERAGQALSKRYVDSQRHTMQVDGVPYIAKIRFESRRGARRSRQETRTRVS